MINITRTPTPPASLNTPEIQQYIGDVQAHLADPDNVPKPKKPAAYRNCDLLEAFDRDFHAKCYLTELQFANSWAMDVEHFHPQNEQPDLVYAWTNLLPADHQANMIKPRKTPPGGYLNPCDPGEDVENEIWYSFEFYGENPSFSARNQQNVKAVNTAVLLHRVHNGHDYNTQRGTETLRKAIQKRYIEILNKIIEWQAAPDDSQQKYQAAQDLKGFLSRKASFTMLMRSIPIVRQVIPADFLD